MEIVNRFHISIKVTHVYIFFSPRDDWNIQKWLHLSRATRSYTAIFADVNINKYNFLTLRCLKPSFTRQSYTGQQSLTISIPNLIVAAVIHLLRSDVIRNSSRAVMLSLRFEISDRGELFVLKHTILDSIIIISNKKNNWILSRSGINLNLYFKNYFRSEKVGGSKKQWLFRGILKLKLLISLF